MYKILKYLLYVAMLLLFFASPFVISFLAEYSKLLAEIKTNFIDYIPIELWGLINLIILAIIINLFRNS